MVWVLGSPACVDDDWRDDYDFLDRSDHVTVYGYDRSADEVFAGSDSALDTQARAAMAFVGSQGPLHLDYRWMSFDFMQGRCPEGARACVLDGELFAQSLPDMGAVGRAVARQRPEGRCAGFLEWGIGEYLGGPSLRAITPSDRDISSLMVGHEDLELDDSARAGHFVSFLVERYGTQAIAELCDAVGAGATVDEWEVGVQVALGVELDTVLAAYAMYPNCSVQQYRARLWECEGEPDFVFSDQEDRFELLLSPMDPRAMNATPGAAGDALITRRIYVPEATELVSLGSPFMAQQCVPCSKGPLVVVSDRDRTEGAGYSAGLYTFTWFFDSSGDLVSARIGSW